MACRCCTTTRRSIRTRRADRTGTGSNRRAPKLRDLALAELAQFDVGRLRPGSRYASIFSSQASHDGARIPTLEAALRLPARFNIELKLLPDHPDWTVAPEEMVERVLDVVDRAEAADRVTIQSFDWRAPRHVARLRSDIPRGWLTRAETVADAPLWRGEKEAVTAMGLVPDAIALEGGGTWTPFYTELTQPLLARAHALGLRVIPWTVNEPADMRRLIGWGVDGLITDWPDRALPLSALASAAGLPGGIPCIAGSLAFIADLLIACRCLGRAPGRLFLVGEPLGLLLGPQPGGLLLLDPLPLGRALLAGLFDGAPGRLAGLERRVIRRSTGLERFQQRFLRLRCGFRTVLECAALEGGHR